MTRPIVEKVTCPNCGTEGDFIMYTSINATYHPKLLKKAESGELFIWKCPKCKRRYYIDYYFFINDDMQRGIVEMDSSANQLKWWHILLAITLIAIVLACILVFT